MYQHASEEKAERMIEEPEQVLQKPFRRVDLRRRGPTCSYGKIINKKGLFCWGTCVFPYTMRALHQSAPSGAFRGSCSRIAR